MDSKKVIVILFILAIVFSLLSITLNVIYGGKGIFVMKSKTSGSGLEKQKEIILKSNDASGVQLFVEK